MAKIASKMQKNAPEVGHFLVCKVQSYNENIKRATRKRQTNEISIMAHIHF